MDPHPTTVCTAGTYGGTRMQVEGAVTVADAGRATTGVGANVGQGPPDAEHQDDVPRRSADDSRRTRDHLANERTFLAWIRTGGAVMALGLLIARFAGDGGSPSGRPLAAGAVLVAVGAAGLVYGTTRYRRVNHEIERNAYVTGSRGTEMVWVAGLLIAGIVAALALLVV